MGNREPEFFAVRPRGAFQSRFKLRAKFSDKGYEG
jgi:hypothetical protein